MDFFDDKTVLLTGASAGIGEALAYELAKGGARLGLVARRKYRLEEVVSQCNRLGARATGMATDVRDLDGLRTAVIQLREQLGSPFDIVVANAGFAISGRVEDLEIDDFRRQFDTNVFGVLSTLYATLQDLKETRGRFVVVGSVAGHVVTPGAAAYCMSKFAVRALAEALYVELSRHGIGVTLISPGFVESELRFKDNQERVRHTVEDPAPSLLVMSRERAAKTIARAIRRGCREKVVTFHGKVAVFMVNHFRGALMRLMRAMALRH